MPDYRRGEHQPFPFRSGRLFVINHEWFFAVREGNPVGPFTSRMEARLALAVYVATRLLENSDALERFLEDDGPRSAEDAMITEAATFQLTWHQHGLPKALSWLRDRVLYLTQPHCLVDHPTDRLAILNFLDRHHVWEDQLFRIDVGDFSLDPLN